MLTEYTLYFLLGAVAGTSAGLLGIGGGLIIVPALAAIFLNQSMPTESIMHLALGTSLATIVFTSISSVYSHHKKHAVDWPGVFKLTPGIVIGAWLGGGVAAQLDSHLLKPIFAFFELSVAAYMLWGKQATPHNNQAGLINFSLSGGIIGCISSLVGIGGGTMSVPWLLWHGRRIHQAIASSAALGLPIALAGSISYLFSGWEKPQLPELSAGYIYLPALLGIVLSSTLFAPLGAHWAHRLDTARLKKLFAYTLIVLATGLLIGG